MLWRARLFSPFLDQPNVGTRFTELTVESQESGGDCFSRFLCLPPVCAVSVLHIICLCWLKLSSQWKRTHWVQGFVTSCFCLVFDSLPPPAAPPAAASSLVAARLSSRRTGLATQKPGDLENRDLVPALFTSTRGAFGAMRYLREAALLQLDVPPVFHCFGRYGNNSSSGQTGSHKTMVGLVWLARDYSIAQATAELRLPTNCSTPSPCHSASQPE